MGLFYIHPKKRRAEGRRLGLLSAKSWTPQEPDADTIRRRELDDRRGNRVRHGTIYTYTAVTEWEIRHSKTGTTKQYDVIFNGYISRTCGPRGIPAEFRP